MEYKKDVSLTIKLDDKEIKALQDLLTMAEYYVDDLIKKSSKGAEADVLSLKIQNERKQWISSFWKAFN